MDKISPETVVGGRGALWIVATIACVLFLIANLPWQLDDYDQAKQAFTSFEMVKEGHWFYQHTPRARVATKPPLVGWISAGVFELTRSWDVAWRLPSLAAALALAIYLMRAGTSAYGRLAGLIALSAFALNLLTPRLGSLVRTDMPLAFVLFLIGLSIWRHIRTNKSWDTRDRVWMFLLLSAGMLIKGPIVYAFLLPGILSFQWWRKKSLGASAWFGWWPWIASLAIFLCWVVGGIRYVPGFYDQVVMHEFVGRFGEVIHRPQPIYFYGPHLLHKFAPWSVLLLVFAWLSWPTKGDEKMVSTRRLAPETIWLLAWSIGGLLVMSCVPSKRVDRILPVIPPLCLLLAAQVGRLESNEQKRIAAQRWTLGAIVFALLFTGGYTGFKVAQAYRDQRDALVEFGRAVRREAAAHHWRYQAVLGADEGIILYLDQTAFAARESAVAGWNTGNLEALVIPEGETPTYLRDLQGPVIVMLRSAERPGLGAHLLLVRGTGN